MSEKPTYDELEQKIQLLEKEIQESHNIELKEQLRESEEQYRKIFEQTAVGIAYSDLEGNFLKINQQFCEEIGYSREELLKMGVPDISHPEDLKQELKLLEKIISGDSHIHVMEKRFFKKSGREIWCKVTVTLERNSAGEPKYFIGVIEDITEHKKVEKDKENLILELQEALKEIKSLRGILPLCSFCKKIRDDKGYWNKLESYISQHSGAEFSHSLCPDCAQKMYPEYNS